MSFTFVCLVVGSAGSGKTTTIQRVQDATRNESTGRAFGLKSLQDELTADGESTHKEEALFLFRSSTRGERSEGEEDENDEEPLAEAEARVLLHEITSGDGGKGGSALALASEVRRTKSIARAALVLFDVTNLSSYTTAKELCKELRGDGEGESECVITLLGNKNFSPSHEREYVRAVATLSAMDFAEEHKCLYFEINALGGHNVLESLSETLRLGLEPPVPYFRQKQAMGKGYNNYYNKKRAPQINKDRMNKMNIVVTSRIRD